MLPVLSLPRVELQPVDSQPARRDSFAHGRWIGVFVVLLKTNVQSTSGSERASAAVHRVRQPVVGSIPNRYLDRAPQVHTISGSTRLPSMPRRTKAKLVLPPVGPGRACRVYTMCVCVRAAHLLDLLRLRMDVSALQAAVGEGPRRGNAEQLHLFALQLAPARPAPGRLAIASGVLDAHFLHRVDERERRRILGYVLRRARVDVSTLTRMSFGERRAHADWETLRLTFTHSWHLRIAGTHSPLMYKLTALLNALWNA